MDDLRQHILRFIARYQTIAWAILLMAGGLLLQTFMWIILPNEMYATVMSYLVLPVRLKTLLVQPWSIVTWPFFMLKLQPITLLISGFILWSFGQIHQHLLGENRTKRLLILVIPIIGLLTVTASTFLGPTPFEAGPDYVEAVAGTDMAETTTDPADSTDTATLTDAQIADQRPPTARKDLLADRVKAANANPWFPSGAMPLVMVLVFSCATLVPSYPIQLLLFGRVKIIFIAGALFVLEILLAALVSPLAIAILIGALLGFLHIYLLRNGTDVTEMIWSYYRGESKPKMTVKYKDVSRTSSASTSYSSPSRSAQTSGEVTQDIIDGILDKISDKGYESLSREEKELLFKASTDKEDERR